MWRNKTIGDPGVRLVFYFLVRLGQPQRDMYWLHRLLHDDEQVLTQLVQVKFTAQAGAERLHGLGCIILAPVETTINDPLKPMAQWLKKSGNGQCRSNDDDGRLRDLPGEQEIG